MPRISFVLPTYNRIAWISECIESLRKQTIKDIEIIVVDDCSTDTTPQLMEWYVKTDPRIVYIRNKENMGAGPSRNAGNKVAKSEIIGVCDSDDFYPDNRAELTLNYFKKNPKTDMVNGSYYRIDYSNNVTEQFQSSKFDPKGFTNGKGVYFCHPSAAYRTEDILKIPYKRETKEKTDDYQLLCDWVAKGKNIKAMKDFVCFHRVLPSSMMTEMRGGSLE